jgi:hypothetical protein
MWYIICERDEMERNEIKEENEIKESKREMERCAQGPRPAGPRL